MFMDEIGERSVCRTWAVNGKFTGLSERRLSIQLPFLAVPVEQRFRSVLRFLHVGLVKRIDSESPSCKRSCHFPQKEFGAQLINGAERSINNRMACIFQLLQHLAPFAK